MRHLHEVRTDVGWLMPPWWADLLPTHGLRREWPQDCVSETDPPLVQTLAAHGRWLEREAIALDARLGEAVEAWLARH